MTRDSFKKIFDSNFEEIRRYILFRGGDPDLADDITQQAFLRLWEKQMKLLPGREKSLLYKIAGDIFVDTVRRKKLENDFSSAFKEKFEENSPDEVLEMKELSERFIKALKKLNESQRVTFLMSRKEGLKNIEIAERLNISVKAVEKRMKGALDLMKRELLTE